MSSPDYRVGGGDTLVGRSVRTARIRFSADILRRLGEELNPHLDKGIVELVKNSYDADATWCRIELRGTESDGGTIVVADNGDGMTPAEIERGWLVLGSSAKVATNVTRLGRIPAGSKGLGRLAALRMGSRARLTTRPRTRRSDEYRLVIDWSRFDATDLVDDVDLNIEHAATSREAGNGTDVGTEIRIEGVRKRIQRMEVKRLARELILLADPFGDDPSGFTPTLVAPDFDDLASLVRNRYFRDAEFHLASSVNEAGYAVAEVVDWRGERLFSAEHDTLAASRKGRPYLCPAVRFDLWVFILDRDTFATRTATVQEVREWLSEFGGVHVYHNGLRVMPYGNPGNDWLDMNLRRVRSPEERPGTNTSIGRLDVTDTRSVLVQKTDRSGYVEDEAYTELVQFAQDAMDWLANRRLEVAEKRRTAQRGAVSQTSRHAGRAVQTAIGSLPPSERKPVEAAFAQYERSRDRETETLHREIQLYRTLSTAGITAATFAHESSGNPIKVIRQSADALARRGRTFLGDRYRSHFQQPITGIQRAVRSLAVLGNATLRLLDHEKRRLSRVDLHDVVRGVLKTFAPFLDGSGVATDVCLCVGTPYVRGSRAAVESIVTNLLNNSLAAFESTGTMGRKMRIATAREDRQWRLVVSDNGPGIVNISKRDIWLPGRTTRRNGTGLGLTIVRDAVGDLGGEVDAREHGDLGGAEITVILPLLGA